MDYHGSDDYGHQNGGQAHGGDAGGHDGQGGGSAVFISNLQWWTTDAEVEAACAPYGRVTSIRFIDDKACGKSRGMAIVEFAEPGAAAMCITGLNGRDMNGRPCRVAHQQQRNQQPGASSSGQYGGRTAGSSQYGGGSDRYGGGGRGGRGRGSMGGRGGRSDDLGGGGDVMGGGGGMVGAAGGMMGPGGMVIMPGMMGSGMMGMGMPGVDAMQAMQGMQMMMPGMMPFGMPGMQGFKPPPPPGAPPKKE